MLLSTSHSFSHEESPSFSHRLYYDQWNTLYVFPSFTYLNTLRLTSNVSLFAATRVLLDKNVKV